MAIDDGENAIEDAIESQSFFERTKDLRKELLQKKAEYREAAVDPQVSQFRLRLLEHTIGALEAQLKRSWPR